MKSAFYLLKFEHLIIFYPLYLLHRMKWKQRQNKGIRKKPHSSCFWVATRKTQSNNTLKSHIPNHSITERCAQSWQLKPAEWTNIQQSSPAWHHCSGWTVQSWLVYFFHTHICTYTSCCCFFKECFPWFTRLHLCLSLQRTRSAVVVKAAAIISVTVTSVE